MVAQKSSLQKIAENPYKLINILDKCGLSKFIPDKEYLKIKYRACIGKKLDLLTPKTFNEKLQWLKLYDRKPIYSTLVDKYAVKEYVASIIGEEYIIPTLGVWDSFDDIDFSSLPNQFVLKCTHDSGGLIICKNKNNFDIKSAKKRINKCLRRNYFWYGREWPYKNVKPQIIAEQYLDSIDTEQLRDYKYFCFNGKPQFLYVSEGLDNHKTASISFFDLKGRQLRFRRNDYKPIDGFVMPPKFDKMESLVRKLATSVSSPFIRVDMYNVNGSIFFSELTFYPCSGMIPFAPEEADYELGKLLDIGKTQ